MKFLLMLLVTSFSARAADFELTFGANADEVEELGEDGREYGLSLGWRYHRYHSGSSFKNGWTSYGAFRSIFTPEIGIGYGGRIGRKFFLELAGGGYYGAISGPAIFGVVGIGINFDNRFYVAIPATANSAFYWTYLPYIGYHL